MPVKWTPEIDQLLLLKILETHELKVDAKKISSAWPTDRGEAPSARAITERLVKIRSNAVKNGAGHFGISSSQAKSASSTPSKPRKSPLKQANGTSNKSTVTNGASHGSNSPTPARNHPNNDGTSKRKHVDLVKTEPEDDNVAASTTHHTFTDTTSTPTKQKQTLAVRPTPMATEDVESPTKRARRAMSGQKSYADLEDDEVRDAGEDSDASVYEEDDEELAV